MKQILQPALQQLQRSALFSDQEIQRCILLDKQGHSNQTCLLQTERKYYILRLFGREERDRMLEYTIQYLAYERDLAPRPLMLDSRHRFMLSAYSSGESKTSLSTEALQTLSQTLQRLHGIPFEGAPLFSKAAQSSLSVYGYDPVLCHNDLNPHNILWEAENPRLIDWEYAGINDRYFDLASLSVEFALNQKERAHLLQSYFHDPEEADHAKLDAYMLFYRDVCSSWWEKQHSPPPSTS